MQRSLRFFWQELGMFLLYRFAEQNLPSFKIKFSFKRKKKAPQIAATNSIVKEHVRKISLLFLHPYFLVTEYSPSLIQSFYKTMIKVVTDLPVSNFGYFSKNLAANGINGKEGLIKFLHEQMSHPERNDSRFVLGFRSLWYILNENKTKLNAQYTQSIMDDLQPFFDAFKHKENFVRK